MDHQPQLQHVLYTVQEYFMNRLRTVTVPIVAVPLMLTLNFCFLNSTQTFIN